MSPLPGAAQNAAHFQVSGCADSQASGCASVQSAFAPRAGGASARGFAIAANLLLLLTGTVEAAQPPRADPRYWNELMTRLLDAGLKGVQITDCGSYDGQELAVSVQDVALGRDDAVSYWTGVQNGDPRLMLTQADKDRWAERDARFSQMHKLPRTELNFFEFDRSGPFGTARIVRTEGFHILHSQLVGSEADKDWQRRRKVELFHALAQELAVAHAECLPNDDGALKRLATIHTSNGEVLVSFPIRPETLVAVAADQRFLAQIRSFHDANQGVVRVMGGADYGKADAWIHLAVASGLIGVWTALFYWSYCPLQPCARRRGFAVDASTPVRKPRRPNHVRNPSPRRKPPYAREKSPEPAMRAVEMLDPGSASREVQQWITDVLNGGTGAAAAMEKALVRLRGEILKALDGQGTAGVAEAVGRFHGLVQCTVRYKTFANWIEFMGIDFDAIRKSVTDVELAGVGDLEDRKALEAAKALIEGVRRFCKAADKTLFTEPVEPFRPHGWGKQPTQGKPAENKAAENKPADPVVTVHLPPGSAGAAGAADDLRVNVATLHAKARFSAQKDRGVIVAGNVFIPAAHIAPHWHVVGERGPVVFKVARNTHIHLTEGDVLRGDALRKVHAFLDANRGIAGWDSMKAYADYLSEP